MERFSVNLKDAPLALIAYKKVSFPVLSGTSNTQAAFTVREK